MPLEVQATYENGVLKLEKPLPLVENERVTVSIKLVAGAIRQSTGLIPWKGDSKALEVPPRPRKPTLGLNMTFADLPVGSPVFLNLNTFVYRFNLVAGRADVGQIEPPVTRHG